LERKIKDGKSTVMKISKIGCGRASVHDFESSDYREYCYVESDLEEWEDAEQSLKWLRGFVNSKVGIHEDVDELERRRNSLNQEIRHLEMRVADASAKWNKIDSFMKKLDAAVEFDPIPF
jgi:chromosome segregation ATPase